MKIDYLLLKQHTPFCGWKSEIYVEYQVQPFYTDAGNLSAKEKVLPHGEEVHIIVSVF